MVTHGTFYQKFQQHLPGWDTPQLIARSSLLARPGYDSKNASEYHDTPATLKKKMKILAKMLVSAKKHESTVVYTGAGISTASGVPDYASKAVGSAAPHLKTPQQKQENRLDIRPTFSHHTIAALDQHGLVHHWLQQNHDRLAQKAGFPQEKLNEIHGAWGDNKNQVVLMADMLRSDLTNWLVEWTKKVRICIAMGTSLCGMTSDSLPIQASNFQLPDFSLSEENEEEIDLNQQNNQQNAVAFDVDNIKKFPLSSGLVIINLQRTSLDDRCVLRVWGTLDVVMKELAKALSISVPNKKAKLLGEQWIEKHPKCKYNTPKRKASM